MKKVFVFIIILLIMIMVALIMVKFFVKDQNIVVTGSNKLENNIIKNEEIIETKKVQIFNGNDRPIAIMIDNVGDARPQARTKRCIYSV